MSTSHWQKVPLSEIAEVRLGRQRSPKRATGPNMRPYMRAANVTWKGISLHDVKEMDFTPDEFETYALRRGDLLLSEASGSASEVGKPAVWNEEVPGCCFQNTLIRVRAPEPLVPFLHLHFYKDALTGEFARAARGVGIHHLGAKTLSEWEIHLPPRDEQQRIVETVDSYFTRLDDVTATLERVRRNLKRYRASILKVAVEGRLVPTEAEIARAERRDYEPASVLLQRILVERRQRWEEAELVRMKAAGRVPKNDRWKARYKEPVTPNAPVLPALPDGWCWASIDQFAPDVQYGSSIKSQPYFASAVPILRMGNIVDGTLSFGNLRYLPTDHHEFPSLLLKPGDVLFNRTNSADLVGKTAVFHEQNYPCTFASYLIRLRCLPGVHADYVAQYLNSIAGRTWIASVSSQQVGQANVNGTKLKACTVPLPPTEEQVRIINASNRALSQITDLAVGVQESLDQCTLLRQAALRSVFEGKLVNSAESGSCLTEEQLASTAVPE